MPKAPPSEKSSFTIVNGETAVSFACKGSVVSGIAEAFTWLSPERRAKLLERLNAKHAQLVAKESERTSLPAAISP